MLTFPAAGFRPWVDGSGADWLRGAIGLVRGATFRVRHRGRERWRCPICTYHGPFADVQRSCGRRRHAVCPRCRAMERHRLQFLVLRDVLRGVDVSRLTLIHFAPEPFFRRRWRRRFAHYVTADLERPDVAVHADLCALPFADDSADLLFASHVMEHVHDDTQAISEICRVLRPGGMALLPVPLVGYSTVEYPEANPHEWGHWRAPARDYFDRYRRAFREVREYTSRMYPAEHQLFVHEDLTRLPTPEMPLRQPVQGGRHEDAVPVCIK